ncbi:MULTISPECIES: FAD-containing oxidoreductase [unclassified Achromobacter]|uniref:FAD-containing oxidoreductase n=1 Tax=unclassified Achromobacter TaxID=2626865 RepID=UPI000B51AA8C|nr:MULTISPECIES: FAD-containing oxidoreductase [unclassified Achromobacter]OWT68189.1 mercuric reductase [Achromobacter sp. HZ34]OWT70026.1 mercuric reductase [Achromobacter sp. HZ28]
MSKQSGHEDHGSSDNDNARARHYDAIIIGAGQAGPALAGRLSDAGMKVAMIERKQFGGTCVNTGCMPTKTLVASAYAAHLARRAADYGVALQGPVGVDIARVKARADTVASNARHGVESWLRGMANCTVYAGHARFTGPHEVAVDGQRLTADRIFINSGGRAVIPDLPGIGGVPVLTNVGMRDLDVLPRHLAIIGGSYIGLEFAQMYRRFGSDVTLVEKGQRLIAREDEDISDAIRAIIENEGIQLRLNADDIRFAEDAGQITVHTHAGQPPVLASHVLVATGRRPNTDDLGLEAAGIATDAHGYIQVDDSLATNVPGVWALGDCNGRGAFTHTAYNDFEIVAANLLDGQARRVSDRIPVYALYIDPPLGRVGMTEAAVRRSGKPALVGTRPMARVGRAVEKGETQGFMKVVVDAESRQLLGAAILGTGGDEAVHGLIDTMSAGAPYTTLRDTVHIHPTVSELIPTVLGDLKPLV